MTTSIPKPRIHHPGLQTNAIGLTRRDYEGSMSTLCAGCGHDSITAAIIRAFWELSIPPHRVAKLSGIGCSSKTPTYFLREAHGFNSVHGRMPSIATGAGAANRDLIMIGISGDGDSLSIGLGQFCHAMRRGVRMLYVLENNGVYGLTKGQFSASADLGTKAKRGEANRNAPIDPVLLALTLGATFVARSFSGDKEQLVPIIKAGLAHRGFAFVDVISPCVTFNDHEGSTKSYRFTRDHMKEVVATDFVPANGSGDDVPDLVPIRTEITAAYAPGTAHDIRMHDGSTVRLRKVAEDFDPGDRDSVYAYIRERQRAGEVPTGLLYMDPNAPDMHEMEGTGDIPLTDVEYRALCPGSAALDALMDEYR
jgi:2-oxoglutarate ferredoxin oxidoreductase subunit beta